MRRRTRSPAQSRQREGERPPARSAPVGPPPRRNGLEGPGARGRSARRGCPRGGSASRRRPREGSGRRRGHAAPDPAGARERRRLRGGRTGRVPQHRGLRAAAARPGRELAGVRASLRRRLLRSRRHDGSTHERGDVFGQVRDGFLVVAGGESGGAQGLRRCDGGRQGTTGRAARRARLARGRDRRRRRRRQRCAAARAPRTAAGTLRDHPRPPRDRAGRSASRRPDHLRSGQLLRGGADGRRLHRLEDPARLGRRARGRDLEDDSCSGAASCATARARLGHPAGQRATGREVARPADARPWRPGTNGAGMACAARGRRFRHRPDRGRPDPSQMPLTVGTAGHIDHGKTWLVRALTGKDTDRLPEEQARGISIDLGYAPLDLPDGRRLSLVDVPGHERFVRTMVAGATGIDLFLLVIDAGEGARPQTHEHLAILRLLGVERGVVAVTKTDAVDAETLELALEEARELVPGAEVVAVSTKTGAGLDELRAALARAATETARDDGPTRLYVDRVFTLPGIDRRELARGDVLVEPGAYSPSYRLDVELEELGAPIPSRALVHHGTSATLARVVRVGRFAQLRLAAPIVAASGDRVVLRAGTTVGGGRIIDSSPPRHADVRRFEGDVAEPTVEERLAGLRRELERQLDAADPLDPGIPLPSESWARDLLPLLGLERRGAKLYRPGATPSLGAREREAAELEATLGATPVKVGDAQLARFLEERGRLVRVGDGYAISPRAYEHAREVLVEELERAERIALARFRDLLDTSRKTAQLLLERFDADGVTRRVGDERVLRRAAARG